MYLHVSIFFALLASTLALPTSNETSTNLEKRLHYGWIGSFVNDNCHGKHVGPRPELKHSISDCCAFTPATNNIGINFGTSAASFSNVIFYSDDNCEAKIDTQKSDYEQPSGGYGCAHGSDFAGSIGSVSIS